jgi:hypothetical protein
MLLSTASRSTSCGFLLQPVEQLPLRCLEHLQRAPAQTQQILHRFRHPFQVAQQFREVLLPM